MKTATLCYAMFTSGYVNRRYSCGCIRTNPACTRPPIRAVFKSYFRVVIAVRGNSAVRRILSGG